MQMRTCGCVNAYIRERVKFHLPSDAFSCPPQLFRILYQLLPLAFHGPSLSICPIWSQDQDEPNHQVRFIHPKPTELIRAAADAERQRACSLSSLEYPPSVWCDVGREDKAGVLLVCRQEPVDGAVLILSHINTGHPAERLPSNQATDHDGSASGQCRGWILP